MAEIFKIRVEDRLFEQSPVSRNTMNLTQKTNTIFNVEDLNMNYIRFRRYWVEDGTPVGVVLWCDFGHGYGFDLGTREVELRPGKIFEFTHEGTCIDDDGCPEEYSIDYYLCLYPWDAFPD